MSQPLNLLCLVVLTYFFLPVLSDDLEEPDLDSKNRLLSDPYMNPTPVQFPQYPIQRQNPDQYLLPYYPAPSPGQYPQPHPGPSPGQYPESYPPPYPLPYPPPYPQPYPPPYPQPYPPPSPGQYPEQYPDQYPAPHPGQGSGQYPAVTPGAAPPNPCPNIFSYVRGANGETEGRIVLPFDQSAVLELNVNASMKGYFGKSSNMKLTLLTPAADIYHKKTQNLIYQIKYPTQKSIPRMTAITLNGRMYCSGPQETLELGGQPITNMHTVHKFFFTVARNNEGDLDDTAVARESDDYVFTESDAQYYGLSNNGT